MDIPRSFSQTHDPKLMASLLEEIHQPRGKTLSMSSAWHLQMDGQSEALSKYSEQYFCCFMGDGHMSVHLYLGPSIGTIQCTRKFPRWPFQALYGREPPTIVRYVMSSSAIELVGLYMLQCNTVMDLLKHNLVKAYQRMKEFASKRWHLIEFKVGEWVFMKLNSYTVLFEIASLP